MRSQHEDGRELLAPVAGQLRKGALLAVLAGGVWPLQAGLLAMAIAGWAAGDAGPARTAALAGGFLLLSLFRAGLAWHADSVLFQAADEVIGTRREHLLRCEARARTAVGSAAIAALIV